MRRLRTSPGRSPGNAIERDQTIFGEPDSWTVLSVKFSGSVPNRRLWTLTGTETRPPAMSPALPVTVRCVAVAVLSADSYALANALAETAFFEAASRSEYIAT